ncbi:MAG: hypothetical protein AUG17_01855 [Crenarchaeota archaeon 13_1_20CM_2_53_14]|nr:MAG: hypothetical protein AUI07_09455 [archaeon 13_2_20CM_2_53_6]OLE59656.1 MAG: hypothetical protein AUG17_01855 [Crenarchaeota archaeon 13_1_20CM_2_53_14]
MNPTMNRQEHKTTLTDSSSMMISPQLHNLILMPNLKPKVARHDQSRLALHSSTLISVLSIENLSVGTSSEGHAS